MGPVSGSHYETLGVEPGSTREQIERAYNLCRALYREGALATYSLVDADEARALRERVEEAFAVLGNPFLRADYDRRHGFPVPVTVGPRLVASGGGAGEPASPWTPRSPQEAPSMLTEAAEPAPPAEPGPASLPAPTSAEPGPGPAAPAPPRPSSPPPAGGSGPELRAWREERGLALKDIAGETRISARILEHIEAERFDQLPPAVYLRSFLQQYARAVGLDPKSVQEKYLARAGRRK